MSIADPLVPVEECTVLDVGSKIEDAGLGWGPARVTHIFRDGGVYVDVGGYGVKIGRYQLQQWGYVAATK